MSEETGESGGAHRRKARAARRVHSTGRQDASAYIKKDSKGRQYDLELWQTFLDKRRAASEAAIERYLSGELEGD